MTADASAMYLLPQTTIFAVTRFAVGENTAAFSPFALISTCLNLHWRPKGNACEHMFVCLCACLCVCLFVCLFVCLDMFVCSVGGVANEQS